MDTSVLATVLRTLFTTVSVIGVLLVIGTILRAKFSIFQKMFLPASVIGGFIGLLLGPIVWKGSPIQQSWVQVASLLPSFLIVPVVASVPLGLEFGSKKGGKKDPSIFKMFLLMSFIGAVQYMTGFGIATIFRSKYDLYNTFGTELSAGFAGGHGTAGVIGSLLQSANQPFWETAQGVTTTYATIGLVGGILLGILLINIASRKGHTTYIQDTKNMPLDMVTGIQKDVTKQVSAGKETTNSSAIDSLTLHVALIMMVSGLAYLLVFTLKKYNVPLLSSIPEWAYAILVMYAVWGTMVKLKLDWVVDTKTKSKISSGLTEFAVVAAIMSLPIEAVFVYLVPLLLTAALGLLFTIGGTYFIAKVLFKDHWFERTLTIMGMSTGVFLTGLLLLKMVDPDLESPVLKDYSISYSINSVIGFIIIPITFSLLMSANFTGAWLLFGGLFVLYGALMIRAIRKITI